MALRVNWFEDSDYFRATAQRMDNCSVVGYASIILSKTDFYISVWGPDGSPWSSGRSGLSLGLLKAKKEAESMLKKIAVGEV